MDRDDHDDIGMYLSTLVHEGTLGPSQLELLLCNYRSNKCSIDQPYVVVSYLQDQTGFELVDLLLLLLFQHGNDYDDF